MEISITSQVSFCLIPIFSPSLPGLVPEVTMSLISISVNFEFYMNVAIHTHSFLGLTLFIEYSPYCVLGVCFFKELCLVFHCVLHHNLFTYLPVDGHLSCLQFLAIMVMNILSHVFWWAH